MNWDYPELYYRVYPKIIQTINSHLGDNYSCENIPEEKMQKMTDEIYAKLVKECPEINDDPAERRCRGNRITSTQRIFFGRGRIIRDLISIFLISELLRRSRQEGFSSPLNQYYYPL